MLIPSWAGHVFAIVGMVFVALVVLGILWAILTFFYRKIAEKRKRLQTEIELLHKKVRRQSKELKDLRDQVTELIAFLNGANEEEEFDIEQTGVEEEQN